MRGRRMPDEILPIAEQVDNILGRPCPLCGWPIQEGEAVKLCAECGAPYHQTCETVPGHCTGCRKERIVLNRERPSAARTSGNTKGLFLAGGAVLVAILFIWLWRW